MNKEVIALIMLGVIIFIGACYALYLWASKPEHPPSYWGEQEDPDPPYPKAAVVQSGTMVDDPTGREVLPFPETPEVNPFPVVNEVPERAIQAQVLVDPFPEVDVDLSRGAVEAVDIELRLPPEVATHIAANPEKTVEALQAAVAMPFPEVWGGAHDGPGEVLPFPEGQKSVEAANVQPVVDSLALGARIKELEATNGALLKDIEELAITVGQMRDLNSGHRTELQEMRQRKDEAYNERNRVVAALATCYPATKWPTAIDGWDKEWNNCVYIELPTGQVSWHYHDDHKALFSHVPRRKTAWDGHNTPVKYQRLRRFTQQYQPK